MKGDLNRKDDIAGDHLVPLTPASVEVLQAIAPLTSASKLVFPSTRHMHRPMSENALGYLLNRAGYHGRHVPHGFRAAFSTIMNEWVNTHGREDDRAVIDLMLAHVPQNKVEGAYNRAAYMERRKELAQVWADMLALGLARPAALLPLQRKRRNGASGPPPQPTGRPQLRLVKG
jgi:integrase